MAGINTSISIVDRATQALRRIITASDRVTDSLNRANRTTQTAFENSHVSEFETELTDAANASNEVAESANETSSAIDRIAASVENAVAGINELVSRMDEASGSTRNTNEEAKKLSPEYKKAAEDAGNLNDVLGKVLSTALLIKGVNFAKDWISGSVDLANTQQKVEQQLKNVLRNTIEVPEIVDVVTQTRINEAVNRSTDTKINEVVNRSNNIINSVQDNVTENYVRNVDTVYSEIEQPELEDLLVTVNADTSPVDEAFERLKAKASQLQSVTIYGDEAFLAGAAELSTYIQDTDALMVALDTLANYAAGMSGGAELDTNAMTDYATQLGKVFMGAYDGIKKKGFELTDVQKEVIERGNDMQKALILSQVINESWDGLAEDMAKLPSGQVVQFKNAWGDVREEIGSKVQPALGNLFSTLNEHMPQIQELISKGTDLVVGVIDAVSDLIDVAADFYDYVNDNWGTIGPVVTGIAIAVGACAASMAVYTVATKLATAAQAIWSSTAVQATTAVAAGVGAAIMAVTLFDNVTLDGANNTYSALGIVAGAFVTVAGTIWNGTLAVAMVVGTVVASIWNAVASLANFVGNVFNNPVGSVIKLFVDMADVILGVIEGIAGAIDWVFGSNLASGVQGWRDDMYAFWQDTWGKNEEFVAKIDINEFTKEVEKYGADIEKWAVNAYDWGDDITRNFNSRSGEDIQDELDDIMNNSAIVPNNPYEGMTAEEMLEEINRLNGTADDIKSNTASGTDMSEILRLLRDISEREAINRFTTAEIKLDIGGITNQVNSKEDIGSLAEYIAGQLEEAVYISAAKLNNA